MFETDRFIEDCRQGLGEQNPHAAVREIVARAVSEPGGILKSLGDPRLSGIQTLYHSDTLTILNVLWGPGMTLYPHDHQMWAVIGIYSGREENSFYYRSESGLIARRKDAQPQREPSARGSGHPLRYKSTGPDHRSDSRLRRRLSSPCRAANGIRRRFRSGLSISTTLKGYSKKRTSA